MLQQVLRTGAGALLSLAVAGGCASAPLAAPPANDTATALQRPAAGAPADIAWLDRLTWGADASDWQALQRLGREAWLQQQFHPGPVAALPPAVQSQIDAMEITRQPLPALARQLEAERHAVDGLADDARKQAAHKAFQEHLGHLGREAATRMLLRAVHSPQQLREQMTWFWVNHFNVHAGKQALRAAVADYENGLREHALGHFGELLRASALHPAMLVYLDNARNAAGRINENYARELLELHTLGVDAGYTQRDVQELARVLTGLGVEDGAMAFRPRRHDAGDKVLLGQVVHGGGLHEIEQVLDRLARHPATARFVSRRIARYFVADTPPPALVDRMAQRFAATDGDIAEVLRVMIGSPEFTASLGGKFKDPLHYVLSAVRLAGDGQPVVDAAPLLGWLQRLGEVPYHHATPDGYPLDEAAWSGAGQMAARFEVARAMAGGGGSRVFQGEGGSPPALGSTVRPLYDAGIAPRLAPATREALQQAAGPREWFALLLASPEFMHR